MQQTAPPSTDLPVQPPAATPLPSTPVPPTPVPPTLVPTTAGRMVTFENIVFFVPLGLTQSEQGQVVPPVVDGAPWDVTVQYTRFDFMGYPLSGTSHQPAIYVFPIEGFDMAADTITALKDLLALRPADANQLPFLPASNTAQVFHAQVKYLDFANGSGVRYLAQAGQGIAPINSQDLFYAYQGLTSDGKYYISVILPISHSILPASGAGANLEQLASNYPAYMAGVRTELEAQPEDSFLPSLAVLDALVQTITVK